MTQRRRLLDRPEVLRILRRAGYPPETITAIEAELPDPVDIDREDHVFARFGVSTSSIMDRMGGSP